MRLLVGLLAMGCCATSSAQQESAPHARLWSLPTRFEENHGQFNKEVRFAARQRGLDLFLTNSGAAIVALHGSARGTSKNASTDRTSFVGFKVHNGSPQVRPEPNGLLAARCNYFIGTEPARTNIPNYSAVTYRDVRPGIDLRFHGSDSEHIEYDLIVAAGHSPDVELDVTGADEIRLLPDGTLSMSVDGKTLQQAPPIVYQALGGIRRPIATSYILISKSRIGFRATGYDPRRAIVIDPTLLYATYLGGSAADVATSIAVDAAGAMYIAGHTLSTDFPSKSPIQIANGGNQDVFVAKLSPAGDSLEYATYLGGSGADFGNAVAVDASGAAYVVGDTQSTNFPTANALQSASGGSFDAFLAKLNPNGSALDYSTYLGGSGIDFGYALSVNSAGAAYVVGSTSSSNFPTINAMQAAPGGGGDAFISKVNPPGTSLAFSTFFGGSGTDEAHGVAVDSSDAVYVVGSTDSTNLPISNPFQQAFAGGGADAFAAKLTATAGSLTYSTYLGGTGIDKGLAVAVDSSGAAYFVGDTTSTDFPTKNAIQSTSLGGGDAFVTKLSPAGGAAFSTYLGGSGPDQGNAVAIDATGAAYVAGATGSADFPVSTAFQTKEGGGGDAFLSKLTPSGSGFVYSSFLGGSMPDEAIAVAVDSAGNAYLAGDTQSADFPVMHAVQSALGGNNTDCFVAKIERFAPLLISPPSATVQTGASQTFAASGGSGAGYAWSLAANQSGGNIDPGTGTYVAGSVAGTDTVHVTDSMGNAADAAVIVVATTADASASTDGGPAKPGTAGCGCRLGAARREEQALLPVLIVLLTATVHCCVSRHRRRRRA